MIEQHYTKYIMTKLKVKEGYKRPKTRKLKQSYWRSCCSQPALIRWRQTERWTDKLEDG